MKSYFKYIVLALIGLSFQSTELFAQIRINQIGIGVSSWTRTYDALDERNLLVDGSNTDDFKPSSSLPNVFIEVGVFKNLGIEGRLGVWDNTFSGRTTLGSTIVVEETIIQRITPLSGGLNYTLSIPNNENFFLHLGAGITKFYIQNEVSREVTGTDGTVRPLVFAGNNNGFYGKVGLEYRFTENLGLMLQGRYNSGQYYQRYKPTLDSDFLREEVSLQGFEVGVALTYRLEKLFAKKQTDVSGNDN